ncbi:F-box/WD repeat-containing protein 7 isoform X5 [Pseudophryne corroboree]|uniref:F-box/WD repeat-containing protein 7 isoform X5 n=1 Tax=Pseudophryne corroboree TaxID=495146 RepID=UPI003081230E
MNQELLSVGSKRRRTGGSVRGNASSSQADEEQMNRVEEEEEQQQHPRQQEEDHIELNGEVGGPGSVERRDPQPELLEENNNSCVVADQSEDHPEDNEQQEEEEDEDHVCDDEDEEEMDQDSDNFDQSDDSSREGEHRNGSDIPNSNSIMDMSHHQKSSLFHTKTKIPLEERTSPAADTPKFPGQTLKRFLYCLPPVNPALETLDFCLVVTIF